MVLTTYLSGLVSKFKDSRVVNNVTDLVKNIIEHKSIQLWSISDDKAEYDRSRRLLDGSLKSVLDAETTSDAILEHGVSKFEKADSVVLLHDPCDIRKSESEKLENLGIVRDLNGKLINGYSTFNTVGVEVNGDNLHPVDITVYSNGDDHYVRVKELENYEKGKLQESDDEAVQERANQIAKFLAEDSHLNLPLVAREQIKRTSEALKEENKNITVKHVMDRQFDDVDLFEFISQELEDEFIIRVKISRNSNEVRFDEEKGKKVAVKLKDVDLDHRQVDIIEKLRAKKKVYQDAKREIEWGTLTLNEQTYSVVRVTLKDRKGNEIYKDPMLLITNIEVKTVEQALEVYGFYLMRAKIESVFKFLKDVLGWEEFQLRDYLSIKNIISLAYFVAGYFYHIGSELVENPVIELIAQLGGGKGKVTRYFILEGLKKLLLYEFIRKFFERNDVQDATLEDMMSFVT